MLDHVSLGVSDLARSARFYADVLGVIGWKVHKQHPTEIAYGPGDDWSFFLYPTEPGDALVGHRMHVAFRADSRAEVRAFYDAALARGASVIADRHPDHRPQFGPDYYGGVLKDPDGHAIEVLTRND